MDDLNLFKAQARAELNKLEAESTAKEVAALAAQIADQKAPKQASGLPW